MTDPFGKNWMLIVRPSKDNWRVWLLTAAQVGPRIES